jgi:hypothetical protein
MRNSAAIEKFLRQPFHSLPNGRVGAIRPPWAASRLPDIAPGFAQRSRFRVCAAPPEIAPKLDYRTNAFPCRLHSSLRKLIL